MGRTYANVPVLSKLKIEGIVHYLKDADARGILNSIDDGVYALLQASVGTVAAGGDHLVTAGNIKAYVDQMVEAGFEVVVLSTLPTADASAYATYRNSIVMVPTSDPSTDNVKDEYIIMRSGAEGSYTYSWEKIGSTDIDLSGYVSNVSYSAASHTLQQTKGGTTTDVHAFGDMADADQGQVDLSAYVKNVTAKVTAAGALAKDATNGVQISGTVSPITVIDSVGSTPSFTEGSFTPNTPTAIDTTKFSGGSKAADTFVQPTLTTQTKALYKQGVTASVGTGEDAETLIIANVAKEADIKVVDTFTQGSFTEGAFTPASLASGFYTAGTAASKAADTWNAGSAPTTKSVTPTFTGDKFKFVGSEVDATVTKTSGGTETVNPKSSS